MSHSSSSSKKIVDSLNKIDPVSFYTFSSALPLYKMSTISPVNISENNPPNTISTFDLNKPAPSQQPGPQFDMLSDHWFEGDLHENKTSKYIILTASGNIII